MLWDISGSWKKSWGLWKHRIVWALWARSEIAPGEGLSYSESFYIWTSPSVFSVSCLCPTFAVVRTSNWWGLLADWQAGCTRPLEVLALHCSLKEMWLPPAPSLNKNTHEDLFSHPAESWNFASWSPQVHFKAVEYRGLWRRQCGERLGCPLEEPFSPRGTEEA